MDVHLKYRFDRSGQASASHCNQTEPSTGPGTAITDGLLTLAFRRPTEEGGEIFHDPLDSDQETHSGKDFSYRRNDKGEGWRNDQEVGLSL